MDKRPLYVIFIMLSILICCTKTTEQYENSAHLEKTKYEKNTKGIFIDAASGVDMSGYTLQETMFKDWYAYEVKNDPGFNPFFIPFNYRCEKGSLDLMQRLTFPVLLAFKFSFLDNNICTRHPAFIYIRDKGTQHLKIDDKQNIQKKMKDWGKNIAIGGTLIQNGSMYRGSLKVFDKKQVLFEKQFDNSAYFELMGKMVSSWIEFSGGTVSHNLKTELMRPMTIDHNTILELGKAFKYEERSKEQWEIYEKILEFDPNFAEVRWWYANQKWWKTRDNRWEASMMLTALESHLVIPALRDVRYTYPKDFAQRFLNINKAAEKSIPNHWLVLSEKYSNELKTSDRLGVIRLSKKAIEMPYAYVFTNKVAYKCYKNQDYHYSIPLMLSIINSKYNPGSGKLSEFRWLVYSYMNLGYLRDSMALISPMFNYTKKRVNAYLMAAYTMDEALDFGAAIKFYEEAFRESPKNPAILSFLTNAYIDAGMTDKVLDIKKRPQWSQMNFRLRQVFEGRLNLINGNYAEAERQLKEAQKGITTTGYFRRFLETALAEKALITGKGDPKTHVENLWENSPRSRKTYILFKKVNKYDSEKMRAYLSVTSRLFPKQKFWQNEYEDYKPFAEIDLNYLSHHFEKIKKSIKSGDGKSFSGFYIEDICLQLIQRDPVKYYDGIIQTYRDYCNIDKPMSIGQKIHRRTFLAFLENIGKKF